MLATVLDARTDAVHAAGMHKSAATGGLREEAPPAPD